MRRRSRLRSTYRCRCGQPPSLRFPSTCCPTARVPPAVARPGTTQRGEEVPGSGWQVSVWLLEGRKDQEGVQPIWHAGEARAPARDPAPGAGALLDRVHWSRCWAHCSTGAGTVPRPPSCGTRGGSSERTDALRLLSSRRFLRLCCSGSSATSGGTAWTPCSGGRWR